VRIPKHVSGLLISLWEPPNSLFVPYKYVTLTGNRLHARYVEKRKHVKTYKDYHLPSQLAVINTLVWLNDNLINIDDNYFDTISVVQKKPIPENLSKPQKLT